MSHNSPYPVYFRTVRASSHALGHFFELLVSISLALRYEGRIEGDMEVTNRVARRVKLGERWGRGGMRKTRREERERGRRTWMEVFNSLHKLCL
jgi:hypothetical protein